MSFLHCDGKDPDLVVIFYGCGRIGPAGVDLLLEHGGNRRGRAFMGLVRRSCLQSFVEPCLGQMIGRPASRPRKRNLAGFGIHDFD